MSLHPRSCSFVLGADTFRDRLQNSCSAASSWRLSPRRRASFRKSGFPHLTPRSSPSSLTCSEASAKVSSPHRLTSRAAGSPLLSQTRRTEHSSRPSFDNTRHFSTNPNTSPTFARRPSTPTPRVPTSHHPLRPSLPPARASSSSSTQPARGTELAHLQIWRWRSRWICGRRWVDWS